MLFKYLQFQAAMMKVDQLRATANGRGNDYQPISNASVYEDLESIKTRFMAYTDILQHPMIAFHAASATAYYWCCRTKETRSMTDLYLANIPEGPGKNVEVKKMMAKWLVLHFFPQYDLIWLDLSVLSSSNHPRILRIYPALLHVSKLHLNC